ncbi:MAG: sulfatase-like hydrolase/transferase [Pseudomonadota bacterium]
MTMNVVSIAIDDLFAYAQFRDSFGVRIETPNLDRLMEQSVNFENAYASIAICAPSRAATMSGKTAWETGVHDNFTPLFDVVDPADTWPAMIRENGYFATSSGKVFHSKGAAELGEIYSETIEATKTTLTAERVLTEGGKKWAYLGSEEDFNDYDVAQFGIDFLDRAPEDQPFLLTLGFDHPHTAYHNPAQYFDLYPIDEIQVPDTWLQGDLSDAPAFAQQFASQPRGGEAFSNLDEWKATVQGYLASVTHMDAQVGRFLDGLAQSEHAQDTAIMIYSDHGYQLGNKDHPVKFTLWEESAKAPLMLYHPDLEGGKTVDTPVSLMDIMPTLLELTGTPVPDGLNGQSLLGFVTGDGEDYQAKPALTSMYGSFAIRSGDYRYIRYQDGGEELYNVVTDPGQNTNLAADPAFASLISEKRTELFEAAREAGALIDPDVAVLVGTDGNDQGVAQPGNQQIALGEGDDVYFVYGNDTEIVELAGEGYDTVYYVGSETYIMPDNVERFYATLPDNRIGIISVIGNDQDNELYTGFTHGIFFGEGGNDQLFGGGWVAHELHGGTGDDTVVGAKFADTLFGDEGNDRLNGLNKNDQIFGGIGDDAIFGGNDHDLIDGGSGNDMLHGETGTDVIFGGAGADFIFAGSGDDIVDAGADNDTVDSGLGRDSISTGDGDDVIHSSGDDFIVGGQGSDSYIIDELDGHRVIDDQGTVGTDTYEIAGTTLDQTTIYKIGTSVHLWISDTRSIWIENATDPADQFVFTDATASLPDLLNTAIVQDAPVAGYGDETLFGTGGDDLFLGLYGKDNYSAKAGDDQLYGGADADVLNGSNGDDVLYGGDGDDSLLGGKGTDVLSGDAGADYLSGSSEKDTYIYTFGDGDDIIDDKGFSDGDRLEISGASIGEIQSQMDGRDLVLDFSDGGSIVVKDFTSDRGFIEEIVVEGQVATFGDAPEPSPLPDSQPGSGQNIIGTDDNDRLTGTIFNDEISDGAGKDNLFGLGGADLFKLSADGVADTIKDFGSGDVIDLSLWGVTSLSDLSISGHVSGKVTVRFGSEVLSIQGSQGDLSADMFTSESFVFMTSDQVVGTDAGDKLIGTEDTDILIDGGGVDNLFGRAGMDTFVLVGDGEADSIKDFEVGVDNIDVTAWNLANFGDLEISDHRTGKVTVRFGDEYVALTLTEADLSARDVTADSFML